MVCYTNKNNVPFQIDEEDFDLVKQNIWHLTNGYVVTSKGRKEFRLHRLIMHTPDGMQTDHINGDILDNRKENLRVCTQNQNLYNQKKRANKSSKYKGVYLHKLANKWMAYIDKDRKRTYLGLFVEEWEAASAYNAKAIEIYGEYARLNVLA